MGKAIAFATPVFFLLIALELLVARARGMAGAYRLNDAVNSLSLGVMSQVVGLFVRVFNYGVYALVFEHVALGVWPPEWWAWALAIVFYDFCYYWNHRLGHESAVFWASHVVHHQSQRYNLSTALRQTSSGAFLGWIFYLPMAIAGVPGVTPWSALKQPGMAMPPASNDPHLPATSLITPSMKLASPMNVATNREVG